MNREKNRKRKYLISAIMIVSSLYLSACGKEVQKEEPKKEQQAVEDLSKYKKMEGTVEQVLGDTALIKVINAEEIETEEKVSAVYTPAFGESEYDNYLFKEVQIGDEVRVYYEGDVEETYPVKINARKVEKIK